MHLVKKISKKTLYYTIVLFMGIAVGLTIKVVSAWVEPDQMPPGGNIAAPLNTSSVGQSKLGGLTLNIKGATYGLIVKQGLVGIGTDTPQAALEIKSTTNGFLPPRMTPAERNAIASPVPGLLIFNTETNKINTYNGSSWEEFSGGGSSGDGVPQGTIAFFDLAACPAGWTEVPELRGRYAVGLPSGGVLGASSATGTALGNMENRATGAHSHPITDSGHSHKLPFGDVNPNAGTGVAVAGVKNVKYGYNTSVLGMTLAPTSSSSSSGVSVNNPDAPNNIPGTNAPYIQYLACKKTSAGGGTGGGGGDSFDGNFNGNINVNGDIHANNYYVNNTNNSLGQNGLCLGGDCKNNWPGAFQANTRTVWNQCCGNNVYQSCYGAYNTVLVFTDSNNQTYTQPYDCAVKTCDCYVAENINGPWGDWKPMLPIKIKDGGCTTCSYVCGCKNY